MRYYFLLSVFGLFPILSFSQSYVQDSVTLGNGNVNQSFYSLANGEQVNTSNTNWDIMIWLNAFSASVRINGGADVQLYELVLNDTTKWNSVDTTGMVQLYNSDTSWATGAFNQPAGDHPDYGWGLYQSMGTLIGKKIFVIKLTDGSYKKIWIKKLNNGIDYKFLAGNLDNSSEFSFHINKTNFPTKSFVYYSIVNNNPVDIEPVADTWDLVFRRYVAEVAPSAFYPVVGVMTNVEVKSAEVRGVPVSDATITETDLYGNIGIIGWDWKVFNNTTFMYEIPDSLSYFVKDRNDDIYHLVFNDFEGSSSGKIVFSKKKISSVGIAGQSDYNIAELSCYPNPVKSGMNLVFDAEHSETYNLSITDLNGKIVQGGSVHIKEGFNNHILSVAGLNSGAYIITLSDTNGEQIHARFIKI